MAGQVAGIGVVVPTRNSARTLRACLESLQAQRRRPTVVVADNGSTDETPVLGRQLANIFIEAGPERSAQRNRGAEALGDVEILGFIDSDMVLGPDVVSEAAELIESGAAGVVVPEVTVGSGYWTGVRRYERELYMGWDSVEALRFVRANIFRAVGGFDETLTGPEDWALTEAVRPWGSIARTEAHIEHDEGQVRYIDACRKKAYYADGLRRYAESRGRKSIVSHLLQRPWLRKPHLLLRSPYGPGVMALKTGESIAVAWALGKQAGGHTAKPAAAEKP